MATQTNIQDALVRLQKLTGNASLTIAHSGGATHFLKAERKLTSGKVRQSEVMALGKTSTQIHDALIGLIEAQAVLEDITAP